MHATFVLQFVLQYCCKQVETLSWVYYHIFDQLVSQQKWGWDAFKITDNIMEVIFYLHITLYSLCHATPCRLWFLQSYTATPYCAVLSCTVPHSNKDDGLLRCLIYANGSQFSCFTIFKVPYQHYIFFLISYFLSCKFNWSFSWILFNSTLTSTSHSE